MKGKAMRQRQGYLLILVSSLVCLLAGAQSGAKYGWQWAGCCCASEMPTFLALPRDKDNHFLDFARVISFHQDGSHKSVVELVHVLPKGDCVNTMGLLRSAAYGESGDLWLMRGKDILKVSPEESKPRLDLYGRAPVAKEDSLCFSAGWVFVNSISMISKLIMIPPDLVSHDQGQSWGPLGMNCYPASSSSGGEEAASTGSVQVPVPDPADGKFYRATLYGGETPEKRSGGDRFSVFTSLALDSYNAVTGWQRESAIDLGSKHVDYLDDISADVSKQTIVVAGENVNNAKWYEGDVLVVDRESGAVRLFKGIAKEQRDYDEVGFHGLCLSNGRAVLALTTKGIAFLDIKTGRCSPARMRDLGYVSFVSRSPNGYLWLGSELGLFLSRDSGETWVHLYSF